MNKTLTGGLVLLAVFFAIGLRGCEPEPDTINQDAPGCHGKRCYA